MTLLMGGVGARSISGGEWPWEQGLLDGGVVLCSLAATGEDPAVDGLVRIGAIATRPGGEIDRLELDCDPWAEGGDLDPAALARILAPLGLEARALEGRPSAAERWGEFERFAAGRPLVVSSLAAFEPWARRFAGEPPLAIGIRELMALFLPGRAAERGDALVLDLADREGRTSPPVVGPTEIALALCELARRVTTREEAVRRVLAIGLSAAWARLAAGEPLAAQRVALALSLVDRPDAWRAAVPSPDPPEPPNRALDDAVRAGAGLEDTLEELVPAWTVRLEALRDASTVPIDRGLRMGFPGEDLARLERVFTEHLPALFAEERGLAEPPPPRESQFAVAREVAANLGASHPQSSELLLVHAPTGTGKTLAYLVPALQWAARWETRVGIATYTRALQEQAMDAEVPRALAALERDGMSASPRVTVLKGRDNYLCWRTLRLQMPEDEDGGEAWLAWMVLVAFALNEPTGDLDRLPWRSPLPLASNRDWTAALGALLAQVRCESSCCTLPEDRLTCGAQVARKIAERSHVVVTNHALALSRRELFRHLIFDECEHLHDQAHAAWSHELPLSALPALVRRLARPGGRSRALFQRLSRALVAGSPTEEALGEARGAARALREAHDALEAEVESFLAWRDERRRERAEREEHSLLREYVELPDGAPLVEARELVLSSGHQLEAALATISERLEKQPHPRLRRLRRSLDLARTELVERLDALQAWIRFVDERPSESEHRFHDVEVAPGGEVTLAARVLLPNEFLGRLYYPELSTATFLSATTWLGGGFEAAMGYLGLDRAAQPAEDEDRPPIPVRTFRAPEVFDYSRVLVCAPGDVPPPREKQAWLEYVRRFIAHVAERTNGRMLVLFTNLEDVRKVGRELEGFFRARRIAFWYQGMPGLAKEELGELFRRRPDSVLLGVDTFWYGADFPGETLEHVVICRLPYGVPDRYHHAQCAVLGTGEQRRRIYMPRALAKFRQGFGRLLRRETDRGVVYLLDARATDPRHRAFLRELPLHGAEPIATPTARLVRGESERCIEAALEHLGLTGEVRRRGLAQPFVARAPRAAREPARDPFLDPEEWTP